MCCSTTLFGVRWVVGRVVYGRGMVPGGYRGGYTGWVIRDPSTQPARFARGDPCTAKRAPEALQGLEWVVQGSDVQGTAAVSQVPPFGPGRSPAEPSLYLGPLIAALQPKGRELRSFPRKLVKTAKCHQNASKRPRLVPIFQNGSEKSPLGILRFPFWASFSHKELMGHI